MSLLLSYLFFPKKLLLCVKQGTQRRKVAVLQQNNISATLQKVLATLCIKLATTAAAQFLLCEKYYKM
jgi:hypothetical protein